MIKAMRLGTITALLFMLADLLALGQQAITICPSGCDYTSIQTAVAAAPNGSAIQIKAGTYQENLTISKSINLAGEGLDKTTLMGSIAISDSQAISVSGLTVTGQGIRVQSSSIIVLLNDAVVGSSSDGLSILNSATVTVWGNTISGNGGSGMVANHANVLVAANTFSKNTGDGVSLIGGSWADLRDNEFDGNGGCAIRADFTSQLSGKDNMGQSNGSGNTCGNVRSEVIAYNLMDLLGNTMHTDSSSGSWTVGYRLTPTEDITVVALRSYFGVKISLWDAQGNPLISVPTNTPEKTWTDVPISSQCLHAGQAYTIAAYSGGGNYYWISGPALLNRTTGALHIGNRAEINSDSYPTNEFTTNMFMVDFEYRPGC